MTDSPAGLGPSADVVPFHAGLGAPSVDLNLTMEPPMMGGPVRWSGSNLIGELDNKTALVMVARTPDFPLRVTAGATAKYCFETVVVRDANSGGSGWPSWPRRAAPLASRLHRIPTHFLLNLHGIQWKLPTFSPPWLSESYHPRSS
jgi:hypothetical protein